MSKDPNGLNTDAAFEAQMAGFELPPPSIADQKQCLQGVQARHRSAWQTSGIMSVVVDKMPVDEGERNISLRRVVLRKGDDTEITEYYIHVGYVKTIAQTAQSKHLKISYENIKVAQEMDGMVAPADGFDFEQADVIAGQAHELLTLKEQGILPNLSTDLGSIFNPATAIMTMPPKETYQ